MSIYQIPSSNTPPSNVSSVSTVNTTIPDLYSNDESGFYEKVQRIPNEYRSSSRAELKSQWGPVGIATQVQIFYRATIVFAILIFLSSPVDQWGVFFALLSFLSGAALATLLMPMYWIVRILAMAIYKNAHKDSFRNIKFWDMYHAANLIANRINSTEPRLFPVPMSNRIDSVSIRPRHYDDLPTVLRSKSRYEFHKRWGVISYFHSGIIIPFIALFMILPYFSPEVNQSNEMLMGWIMYVFSILLAVGLFYKIPKILLLSGMTKKHFPGIPAKEVSSYLSLTRKYVDLVEPRLYRRILLRVKGSLFDSVKTKLALYSPSDTGQFSSLQGVSTESQVVHQESIHDNSLPTISSGPTPIYQMAPAQDTVSTPTPQLLTRAQRRNLMNSNQSSIVSGNSITPAQNLSNIFEYERKLGLR